MSNDPTGSNHESPTSSSADGATDDGPIDDVTLDAISTPPVSVDEVVAADNVDIQASANADNDETSVEAAATNEIGANEADTLVNAESPAEPLAAADDDTSSAANAADPESAPAAAEDVQTLIDDDSEAMAPTFSTNASDIPPSADGPAPSSCGDSRGGSADGPAPSSCGDSRGGSAGARAARRVRPGLRLTTTLAASVLAIATLPAAAGIAAIVAYPTVAPKAPPSAPAIDLAVVDAALESAQAHQVSTQELLVETITESLTLKAEANAAIVKQAIAVARDKRRSNGKKGKALTEPFRASELSTLPTLLNLKDDPNRTVLRRSGEVVFGPESIPESWATSSTASEADSATLTADGVLFRRRCVVNEKLCVVERRTLPNATLSLKSGRDHIASTTLALEKHSAAIAAARPGQNEGVSSTERDERRLWTLVGALLLALLGAALVIVRVRDAITQPLQAVTHRTNLIAQGHAAPAPDVVAAKEFADLHDALDDVAAAAQAQHEQMLTVDAKRDRLVVLADTLDAIARGDLNVRADVTGSVTEQALATAANRVADALSRHGARLGSHLDVLLDSEQNAPANSENVRRRVAALKPMSPLIADIGQRLTALASNPTLDDATRRDLARLGDAISARAKTAASLFQALERETNGGAASTTDGQRRALEHLRDDLKAFAAAPALPTLLLGLSSGPSRLEHDEMFHRAVAGRSSESSAQNPA